MREADLAIVGAGVAGLAAAAEAARLGLKVLVIERMGAGGQVMTVERIDNMPGFPPGTSGFELGPALQERAEDAGAEFMLGEVQRVEPVAGGHVLHGEEEAVRARAVLLAAGSLRRKLGVPGEAALEGRGVSHCASCDGPLFRGQSVCVVGGGDSGFGEALVLATHARQVRVVFREAQPHAQAALVEEARALPNVQLLAGAEVVAVRGATQVEGLQVRLADGSEQAVDAAGVFVCAGLQADTGFLRGLLQLDAEGRIVTGADHGSSVPGIFAAGDIRAGVPWLLAAAAQDGTAAAQAVHRFLAH